MYKINRKTDLPDIGYMEARASQLMKRGIRLADCQNIRDYYISLSTQLESDFSSKYGVQNPRSPKQVVEYIKLLANAVELKSKNDIINICYNSETGKWTTDANALSKLSDLGYEFAQDLLDYRHAKKYAESITSIMEAADENMLIHPEVGLTKTNRLSYSKPALMSIPKKLLWTLIKPSTDDKQLYSVDIKNQEPHLLISMTGAKELQYALEAPEGLYETMFKQCFQPTVTANVLIDTFMENRRYTPEEIRTIGTISPALYSSVKPSSTIFLNGKRIISMETVCIGSEKGVYPDLPSTINVELEDSSIEAVDVEWNESEIKYKRATDYTVTGKLKNVEIKITKAERNEFKTSWLAISYGSGIQNIQEVCKIIDGKRVYKYITQIEAIKNYRSMISKVASQGINVIGTTFGTRLYAGIDGSERSKLKRVLLDLPIQGSGSDILSLLIMHFDKYTKENNLEEYINIYYTRHDELILEVDKQWEDTVGQYKVEEILRDIFEHQIDDWTPFKLEVTRLTPGDINMNVEDDE